MGMIAQPLEQPPCRNTLVTFLGNWTLAGAMIAPHFHQPSLLLVADTPSYLNFAVMKKINKKLNSGSCKIHSTTVAFQLLTLYASPGTQSRILFIVILKTWNKYPKEGQIWWINVMVLCSWNIIQVCMFLFLRIIAPGTYSNFWTANVYNGRAPLKCSISRLPILH